TRIFQKNTIPYFQDPCFDLSGNDRQITLSPYFSTMKILQNGPIGKSITPGNFFLQHSFNFKYKDISKEHYSIFSGPITRIFQKNTIPYFQDPCFDLSGNDRQITLSPYFSTMKILQNGPIGKSITPGNFFLQHSFNFKYKDISKDNYSIFSGPITVSILSTRIFQKNTIPYFQDPCFDLSGNDRQITLSPYFSTMKILQNGPIGKSITPGNFFLQHSFNFKYKDISKEQLFHIFRTHVLTFRENDRQITLSPYFSTMKILQNGLIGKSITPGNFFLQHSFNFKYKDISKEHYSIFSGPISFECAKWLAGLK
ncbi:hypothetical protein Anas_14713, partial [Armadillidium nasatum]